MLANKQLRRGSQFKDLDFDLASLTAHRPSGTYTIYHKKHHVMATKPNQAILEPEEPNLDAEKENTDGKPNEHLNKLWLIVKSLKLGEKNQNKFYLQGGEIFKLGRVVMKIHEVNTEQPENRAAAEAEPNRSQEDNTQMSFAEINDGEQVEPEQHDGQVAALNQQIEQAASQEQALNAGNAMVDIDQILLQAPHDDLDIMDRPTHFERFGSLEAGQQHRNEADESEEHKEQPTVAFNSAQIQPTEENLAKNQQDDVIQEPMKVEENQSQRSNQQVCRICFEEDLGKENPLISPCNCSGSMKFVHLKCL